MRRQIRGWHHGLDLPPRLPHSNLTALEPSKRVDPPLGLPTCGIPTHISILLHLQRLHVAALLYTCPAHNYELLGGGIGFNSLEKASFGC